MVADRAGRPGRGGRSGYTKGNTARLAVQVRDTAYMVLAQPVQVQRMLALLHQAVMAAAGSSEGKQVQLVLRQTVIDRVGEQNTRLELVLQGITALPAASTGELEQLTADLGGSLTMQEEQEGSKSCCLALPGWPCWQRFTPICHGQSCC